MGRKGRGGRESLTCLNVKEENGEGIIEEEGEWGRNRGTEGAGRGE